MKFWLGTHIVKWLREEEDLFISRRRLTSYKKLPIAKGSWCLDSGGFTELNIFGEWKTKEKEYIKEVERFRDEIGNLEWCSPMDWMCEPSMLNKTGKTILEHQKLTIKNFLKLRNELGYLVIPVLQGWERDDYLKCIDMYEYEGIDLSSEMLVGIGSVCRRQNTKEIEDIICCLEGLNLHGFGVKTSGIKRYGKKLNSSDSMSWSYAARRSKALAGCTTHKNCANCLKYARQWKEKILNLIEEIE
jgi:hypothetical protein